MREVGADEVEQEITQRDQFNTDEAGLLETLIREPHQNSLDGRSTRNTGPVRTRIRVVEPNGNHADFWAKLLSPLGRHLEACGIEYDRSALTDPRLLTIEDFGTTGLLGAIDRKDKQNFSDFWRRFGRSHKGGSQGGRWGLGKLVFSYSSTIRTFFGLTVRDDDDAQVPLLMGQAVLSTHVIDGKEYAPHAFLAVRRDDGFQLPETDRTLIDQMVTAAGLVRSGEPGLSVVVPGVRADVTVESLLPFVVRNYFFPILTGVLVVDLGEFVLDSTSFDGLATAHGGPELSDGHLITFIRELHEATKSPAEFTLDPNWPKTGIEKALGEKSLGELRKKYADGGLAVVRAPIALRNKDNELKTSFVDLYLRRAVEGVRGSALYVRGNITIPGEAKAFAGRGCFGALVAKDPTIVEFLGDAENPSHTRWTGNAEKLTSRWKAGAVRISEVRSLLNQLYDAAAVVADRVDANALVDFFSVEQLVSATTTRKPKPSPDKPIIPPIKGKPKRYRMTQIAQGFAIKGNPDVSVPYDITVKAAYAVFRGNPFSKHKALDFDFENPADLDITVVGATCKAASANELQIEVHDSEFALTVKGFDANRDLIVRDGGAK